MATSIEKQLRKARAKEAARAAAANSNQSTINQPNQENTMNNELNAAIALNLNDNATIETDPVGPDGTIETKINEPVVEKKGRFQFSANTVASTRKGGQNRNYIFYEVIGVPSSSTKMQPQKALCLQLVNDNTSEENPMISEPDMKAIVEAAKADGTLETKQDAWRIFQYYKGMLVEEGFLAEHNMKGKK
jgi:hypothetical protein